MIAMIYLGPQGTDQREDGDDVSKTALTILSVRTFAVSPYCGGSSSSTRVEK